MHRTGELWGSHGQREHQRFGQLVIAATRSYEPRTPVVVAVTVPALTSIETTGSGDVTAQGLQAAELRIQAQGSGAVTATGTAGRVTVTATGSGGIRLADLVVRVMEIRATGSSTLDVHITDALTGTLMGTGDLIYRGTPQLAVRALGTGQVRPG
ncbi:MAG: DUF2807 domain-containing protein [Chloroflexi bacterium]|nr:DUF2807 domain-containing protein [Chloroflexota bacterium]